jgi:hypothetical protein
MKASIGMTPLEPIEGGTFVTHHMVFQKKFVNEMLDLMGEVTGSLDPWPLLIMSFSRKFYRFSEYKTYATYMVRLHPKEFNHHILPNFGEGGLRFREANCVVEEMLSRCKVLHGGLSYAQVREFVLTNWKKLSSHGQDVPAYIQLDHVYGLQGVDLNFLDNANNSVMETSMTSTEASTVSSPTSSSVSGIGEDCRHDPVDSSFVSKRIPLLDEFSFREREDEMGLRKKSRVQSSR